MTTLTHRMRIPRALCAVLSGLMLSMALTPAAVAQSESDLRRQNQELATRVKDLEAELDASRTKVEMLQNQVAALQQQLAAVRAGGGSAAAPLEAPKTTIDESKPNASPRALFAAVATSYDKAVENSPLGQPNDRDRVAYMRKIEKWKAATEREHRGPIQWVVRVVEDSPTAVPTRNIYTFVSVDPVTNARLGDEFNVTLSRQLATRLAEVNARGGGPMVMKGTVIPSIRINPARMERGAFDNPRFVGPFAEYDFTVEVASLTQFEPAQPEDSERQPQG